MEADLQRRLEALASPIRREILWQVWGREVAAGAIAATFALSAPTISAHLRILREAGLVRTRVAGTFRYYRADEDALRSLQPLLVPPGDRWEPADALPEVAATVGGRRTAVVVAAHVPVPAVDAYRGLTDDQLFSRWLGVDVTIDQGVLAAEMEWGTRIRGHYEHLIEPRFIHFSWDVADEQIPAPGAELPAYVHLRDTDGGRCDVLVNQLVDDDEQAAFMDVAWGLVLGRLRDGIVAALAGSGPRRARRPKRSRRTS